MAQRKADKTAEKIAVENSFQSISSKWMEHWQDEKSPRHVDYVKRHRVERLKVTFSPASELTLLPKSTHRNS
jgi:hypothetical protein